MKTTLIPLLAIAIGIGSSACRKRNTTPAEAAPDQETKVEPATAEPAAVPGQQAAPQTVQAATGLPQAKPGASESGALNGELTDAVARFRDRHKRLPASWQELVQTGFLKSLPQPPPGVRYAIDPVSAMVVEVK